MEKLTVDLSFKGGNQAEGLPASEIVCSKKIKPRAFIFKANNNDFDKIKELIETHFPEVQILYVTTAPVGSILRVAKSLPFERQDPSSQPYTIE